MKLSSTLVVLASISLTLGAPVAEPAGNLVARNGPTRFTVSPPGASCGSGTSIYCSGTGCKGNFSPGQSTIVVTEAAGNCHISLYTGSNQSGTITERLNTDTTGTCLDERELVVSNGVGRLKGVGSVLLSVIFALWRRPERPRSLLADIAVFEDSNS
ncbi:hypothetical protein MMC27_008658 [Xylographa pallens]|nr:hypothetical protein [Xylographa pallens]